MPFLFIESPDLTDEQLSRKRFDLLTSTSAPAQMPLYLYCSARWSWKSVSTHVSTSPGWADTSGGAWAWMGSGRGPSTVREHSHPIWFPLALFNVFPPACHLFGILSVLLFCAFVSATLFFFLILRTSKSSRDSLGYIPGSKAFCSRAQMPHLRSLWHHSSQESSPEGFT